MNPANTNTFTNQDGIGERITSGGNTPWHVNGNGDMFVWTPDNKWGQIPGSARDIAVGANGQVWHAGHQSRDVYHMSSHGGWQYFGCKADRITADGNGLPWIIDYQQGKILRRL